MAYNNYLSEQILKPKNLFNFDSEKFEISRFEQEH